MIKKSLLVCAILSSSFSSLFAQKAEDIDLLRNMNFTQEVFNVRKVSYGFSENPSKASLYNPLYHILSSSMYIYQKFVSPQLSRECMYSPSCSAYSKALIKKYGIFKGVFCTADRLMRCNRIALAGLPIDAFDIHDHKAHENVERYTP